MPSAPQRPPAPSAEAAPVDDERGTLGVIGATAVALALSIGAHIAGGAWGLSRDDVQTLELIVPAAVLGALEVWTPASQRVERDANRRREDRFVALGRGGLIGASLAVLSAALVEHGFPAVGRLLAPAGASHVEAADHWWALLTAVALSVAAARALRAAVKHYPRMRTDLSSFHSSRRP
jgi:hypothetical protein